MTPAYLDHNATAPLRPEALAAMTEVLAGPGNASSIHRFGREARKRIEAARAAVAALVAVPPEQVIFTSGGSEANNLALRGADAASLIVGATEHEAVLQPAHGAGLPMRLLPVLADGRADLVALERLLAELPRPALVALMLANNETGVIHPVAEAAAIARAAGATLHCDAVQAAGRLPLDLAALGATTLSLSAHKIGGPQGVGALIVAPGHDVDPLIRGGGQEMGRRAGTENVAGIVGFGVAARLARAEIGQWAEVAALRDRYEAALRAVCQGAPVYGAEAPRLPNTSLVGMPGVSAETQVMAFDLDGLAVSSGAACSSGKVRPSHVLLAMGVPQDAAREAIRASFGRATTADEVDRLIAAWTTLWRRRTAA